MPIYEYRCDSCGFQKEFIQRMSDARLTQCPECKQETFNKMVTAAGFQLKGGGWYVTDFKNSGSASSGKKTEEKQTDTSGKPEDGKSESKEGGVSSSSTSTSGSGSSTPAAAPAASTPAASSSS